MKRLSIQSGQLEIIVHRLEGKEKKSFILVFHLAHFLIHWKNPMGLVFG